MKNTRRPQRSKRERWHKTVADITNTVVVDGSFEHAFRLFKKKVRKSGIILECKRRKHYTKPSEVRKIALKKAIKREQNRL